MQAIVYQHSEGGVHVLTPAPEFSILEAGRKDVPEGAPFIIVDADELPDRALISAWEVDFSEPDGHGIGPEAWFSEQRQQKDAAEAKERKRLAEAATEAEHEAEAATKAEEVQQ
jgi:hypothetical protein